MISYTLYYSSTFQTDRLNDLYQRAMQYQQWSILSSLDALHVFPGIVHRQCYIETVQAAQNAHHPSGLDTLSPLYLDETQDRHSQVELAPTHVISTS